MYSPASKFGVYGLLVFIVSVMFPLNVTFEFAISSPVKLLYTIMSIATFPSMSFSTLYSILVSVFGCILIVEYVVPYISLGSKYFMFSVNSSVVVGVYLIVLPVSVISSPFMVTLMLPVIVWLLSSVILINNVFSFNTTHFSYSVLMCAVFGVFPDIVTPVFATALFP